MIIPYEILSREVFQGLFEEFISREGTDFEYSNKSPEENVEIVKRQLKQGDAFIIYDRAIEKTKIVLRKHLELNLIISLPL
jgi:uncharacterized protein YheU (UPF0270 family)